jgi:hypothetical protein
MEVSSIKINIIHQELAKLIQIDLYTEKINYHNQYSLNQSLLWHSIINP